MFFASLIFLLHRLLKGFCQIFEYFQKKMKKYHFFNKKMQIPLKLTFWKVFTLFRMGLKRSGSGKIRSSGIHNWLFVLLRALWTTMEITIIELVESIEWNPHRQKPVQIMFYSALAELLNSSFSDFTISRWIENMKSIPHLIYRLLFLNYCFFWALGFFFSI